MPYLYRTIDRKTKYKVEERVICLYDGADYLKRGTIKRCAVTGMYSIVFDDGTRGGYYSNNLVNAKEFLQIQLEG